jgi:hypothetical protein
MKIGVIGCTHVPQAMPALPNNLPLVFKGVDIILHVGDANDIATLKQLENNFTITMAVSGESDTDELKHYVEPKRVVEFAKRRIGMIHGHEFVPPAPKGIIERLLTLFSKPKPQDMTPLYHYLLGQFTSVDAIVFGHTHQPYVNTINGVFLFNPGAAALMGNNRPSVGIMHVETHSISGRIIYL